MDHPDSNNGPDIAVTLPPHANRIPAVLVPNLPAVLLDQINEVYLLHTLATNASQILPPGKSLLSLLSPRNRRTDDAGSQNAKSLKAQVSDVVTRAFWDEARKSLSSSTASVQLTRLRLLYDDLSTEVATLVPSSHPIMYTLSNPMSPTSSPLRSAAGHLRVLLSVLRERCAPVRDADVDVLINNLHDPSLSELPQAIVDTVRGIFELTAVMKDDLADFVVGTWTEQEALQWIRRHAIDRERRTVTSMFPDEIIKDSYREWLGPEMIPGSSRRRRIVNRLMDALSFPESVSPFPPSENLLPPQLIFVAFDLVKLQNLLQALVIAASLRSLVRAVDNSWLGRVWALLDMEVERGGTEPAETKLLNLEDEVVQAAGSLGNADSEKKLREAVQRTLKTQDPVFVLLQKRLVGAIRDRLTETRTAIPTQVPAQMRTGRGRFTDAEMEHYQEPDLVVKGFEDPVLKENMKRLVWLLRECLRWIEDSWGEGFADGIVQSTAN